MVARSIGEIRRGQLITTYGVGSVIAVGDESFMVAGIDRWLIGAPDVHEPVLQRQLGVNGFVAPPSSEIGAGIPVVRFPEWSYCPMCRRLAHYSEFGAYHDNRCGLCDRSLVPSRFIAVCEDGHTEDFPYFRWSHRGRATSGDRHELRIDAGGESASMRDVVISCVCGAEVSMDGVFGRQALRGVAACSGRRPWLAASDEDSCDKALRTLLRGASNVWFPLVRSALSIPPWSEEAFKALNRFWPALRPLTVDAALRVAIEGIIAASDLPYSVDELAEAVRRRRAAEAEDSSLDDADVRRDEYEALVRGRHEDAGQNDFVCEPVHTTGHAMDAWIDHVSAVRRLREVRVLQAFTRVLPPSPAEPERRAPLSASEEDWLPGVNVIGEGVFFRIAERALRQWETDPDVLDRVAPIRRNYVRAFGRRDREPDREITPRLVLIHTLSHALIGQWALDSGYPAASLRERIYAGESANGLLIYTAASDSAGSLGGIVELAESDSLWSTFQSALLTASWCSSDPVCIESEAAGTDSLNLAACHACTLLPEVSCEESNLLLDRALLIGTPDRPQLGFFAGAIAED